MLCCPRVVKFTRFPYKEKAYTFINMSIDSWESTLQIYTFLLGFQKNSLNNPFFCNKKGSAHALPKPKVGQNTGQKADALRSTSPNATIMRSNFFDLTKATAAIRLHFDKFRNPVHIVQAHDLLEKPFHFIRF